MRKAAGISWGKPVFGLLKLSGITYGLPTPPTTLPGCPVDNTPLFYSRLEDFLPAFLHRFLGVLISVMPKVLTPFHMTYNKARRVYLNNLVINS